MINYRVLLEDLKQIIESIPTVSRVSHGKPKPLSLEDVVPTVYINPLNGLFESFKNTTGICGYDNYEYIRLTVNMECKEDLEWIELRNSIIEAVLNDSAIWRTVLDRNIVTWANDDFDNYPRKQFDIGFEFRLRA